MDWVKLLTFTKAQLLLRKVKNRRYNLTYHHASQVVNRQYEKWMFRGAGSWPSWLFRLVSCWGYPPGTGCPAQLFVARVGGAFESCRGHHFCGHRSGSCSAPGLGRRYVRFPGDHISFPGDSAPDPRGSHGGRGDQALPRRFGLAALVHAHRLRSDDCVAFGLGLGSGPASGKRDQPSKMAGKPVTNQGNSANNTQAKTIRATNGMTALYRSTISTPGGATPFR